MSLHISFLLAVYTAHLKERLWHACMLPKCTTDTSPPNKTLRKPADRACVCCNIIDAKIYAASRLEMRLKLANCSLVRPLVCCLSFSAVPLLSFRMRARISFSTSSFSPLPFLFSTTLVLRFPALTELFVFTRDRGRLERSSKAHLEKGREWQVKMHNVLQQPYWLCSIEAALRPVSAISR